MHVTISVDIVIIEDPAHMVALRGEQSRLPLLKILCIRL